MAPNEPNGDCGDALTSAWAGGVAPVAVAVWTTWTTTGAVVFAGITSRSRFAVASHSPNDPIALRTGPGCRSSASTGADGATSAATGGAVAAAGAVVTTILTRCSSGGAGAAGGTLMCTVATEFGGATSAWAGGVFGGGESSAATGGSCELGSSGAGGAGERDDRRQLGRVDLVLGFSGQGHAQHYQRDPTESHNPPFQRHGRPPFVR